MIIYARSPYFVTVNETSQVGSKVELFIWNEPNDAPEDPTYILAKPMASTSQRRNDYNIAPFIKEYIDNVSPIYTNEKMYAKVRVDRYKETTYGSYTLLDSTTYVGVNGFTEYRDGVNKTDSSSKFVVLGDTATTYNYPLGLIPFVNVVLNTVLGDKVEVTHTDLAGGNSATTTILATTDATGIYFKSFGLTTTSSNYANGCIATVKYYSGSTLITTKVFRSIPICEPKYTPMVVAFVNRFGGWQYLTFFKAKIESMTMSSQTYKMLNDSISYVPQQPQYQSFSVNGKESVRLNTGWVDENYKTIIKDLLLSETVLVEGVCADVKTSSIEMQSSLNNKNINYQIEFEYAYDILNNAI